MKTAAYGSWESPITAQLVTKAAPSLDQPQFDGENLYWLEARPWESGRNVIMRKRADGGVEDVLPFPLSARSRIHEYGGAPYLVADNVIYYCLDSDQRVYRFDLGQEDPQAEVLTPEVSWRYSDFTLDIVGNRLLAACEKHADGKALPDNVVVSIPLDGSLHVTTLLEGADFYSNARISPCGNKLSWLSWNHPNMPWDETELWVATLNDNGMPVEAKLLAGGQLTGRPESVFQPQWHSNGDLYFVSDRDNWWSLYYIAFDHGNTITAVCSGIDRSVDRVDDLEIQHGIGRVIDHGTVISEAEFATPQWVFGMSTYGFIDAETIACSYTREGLWYLATINVESGLLKNIGTPHTAFHALGCKKGKACVIGAAAELAPEVVVFNKDKNDISTVYHSGELPVSSQYLSTPKTISFASGAAEAHAFFYSPRNGDFNAPPNTLPPLIVMCHGGPTAACDSSLSFKIQYWTSRGFAVLDVNYRGSTGYGREYRDALKGQWGIVDVNDAVNAANYVADQKLVDRQQMAIRGGSAGGYTVLSALTFHQTFKAGASLYGIGDLELLVAGTHKFEAHYTDSLIGPYPQDKAIYQQRSPINHIDGLTCPVIFLQGLDDKVVPPNQAELMVDALREKNIPVAYVAFEGEGHGFRKAENIKAALDAELYFYSRVFGFELSDDIVPINIENLK